VTAVLDGGVELLRRDLRRWLGVTAVLFVPIWVLNIGLSLVAPPDSVEQAGFDWTGLSTVSSSSLVWIPLGLQVIALSVLGMCVGHVVAQEHQGHPVNGAELARFAWSRSWVALLIVPLNAVPHGLGLCLAGVGWVLADAMVLCTSVVAGAERLGPWRAFTRGLALTTSNYGRALGVSVGGLVMTQLIRLSLSVGPSWLLLQLVPGSPVVPLLGAMSTAVLLLTQPLSACIAARAYLDFCCRREGLDLAQRAQVLLDAPGATGP
jgi:hypothetical protein